MPDLNHTGRANLRDNDLLDVQTNGVDRQGLQAALEEIQFLRDQADASNEEPRATIHMLEDRLESIHSLSKPDKEK